MVMKAMPAAQFKAHCLRVMDEVNRTRQPVVITKKGKPVAKLVPADTPSRDVFDCLKDVFKVIGDIESPAVPPEEWEVVR
jgi:prevent-host-death family protein